MSLITITHIRRNSIQNTSSIPRNLNKRLSTKLNLLTSLTSQELKRLSKSLLKIPNIQSKRTNTRRSITIRIIISNISKILSNNPTISLRQNIKHSITSQIHQLNTSTTNINTSTISNLQIISILPTKRTITIPIPNKIPSTRINIPRKTRTILNTPTKPLLKIQSLNSTTLNNPTHTSRIRNVTQNNIHITIIQSTSTSRKHTRQISLHKIINVRQTLLTNNTNPPTITINSPNRNIRITTRKSNIPRRIIHSISTRRNQHTSIIIIQPKKLRLNNRTMIQINQIIRTNKLTLIIPITNPQRNSKINTSLITPNTTTRKLISSQLRLLTSLRRQNLIKRNKILTKIPDILSKRTNRSHILITNLKSIPISTIRKHLRNNTTTTPTQNIKHLLTMQINQPNTNITNSITTRISNTQIISILPTKRTIISLPSKIPLHRLNINSITTNATSTPTKPIREINRLNTSRSTLIQTTLISTITQNNIHITIIQSTSSSRKHTRQISLHKSINLIQSPILTNQNTTPITINRPNLMLSLVIRKTQQTSPITNIKLTTTSSTTNLSQLLQIITTIITINHKIF